MAKKQWYPIIRAIAILVSLVELAAHASLAHATPVSHAHAAPKNLLHTASANPAHLDRTNPGRPPHSAPKPQPLTPPATPHTLLWKITGKGLKNPSYLFGTMHVLCADEANLSDSLKAVINRVDEVYFEINLGDVGAMMNALKFMRMNDNKKLSDLMTPEEYAKVKAYFSKVSPALPFGMLERFKPLLVSSLIEEQGLGCKTVDGMEMQIMHQINGGTGLTADPKENKKAINGLETLEFQAGLFDSIPYDQQAKDLLNYIDSSETYKKTSRELALVYKNQDLDKIDELTKKGDPSMSGYMDLLLYGRNRKWIKTLKDILGTKSVLVAVGAAHLPGDQGVIGLLQKEGYTLTPVKN